MKIFAYAAVVITALTALIVIARLAFASIAKLGLLLFIPVIIYLGINGAITSGMPYFSDDIYNITVAPKILEDLIHNLKINYNYARFPFNIVLLFGILSGIPNSPELAHLFVFCLHLASVGLLFSIISKFIELNRIAIAIAIILAFSLFSNIENLLWISSLHVTAGLFFSLLSVWLLCRYFETFRLIFWAGSFIYYAAALLSSETSYILTLLHSFSFFLLLKENADLGLKKNLLRWLKVFLPFLLLPILIRATYVFIGYAITSTPYDISGASSQTIVALISQMLRLPFEDLKAPAILCAASLLIVVLGSKGKERLTALAIFSLLFIVAILLTIAYLFAALPLGMAFPRFSYQWGIFLAAIVTYSLSILRNPRCLSAGVLFFFVFTGWRAYHWSNDVLAKIPPTARYIERFSTQSRDLLTPENIVPNSMVLFSFSPPPPDKLIPTVRPYDLLQWNHTIVGFCSAPFLESPIDGLRCMPLDAPGDSISSPNITLTGWYWSQYGNSVESFKKMTEELSISNLYHLRYQDEALRFAPLENPPVYGQQFDFQDKIHLH